MRIAHIAIWVSDLETMKRFYQGYFGAVSGGKYENPSKGFASYFLELGDSARIEIMTRRGVVRKTDTNAECLGFAHFAVSVGSKARVDEVTSRLKVDGFPVIDGPRITGDGCYESVVLDPEGNRIEVTV